MEWHASSVAICGKISLPVRQIVSIPVHDVLNLIILFSAPACALLCCVSWVVASVLNLWHYAILLPLSCVVTHALHFCVCPEFMALCQVVASILRCYP